jgi:hypothetical protein
MGAILAPWVPLSVILPLPRYAQINARVAARNGAMAGDGAFAVRDFAS